MEAIKKRIHEVENKPKSGRDGKARLGKARLSELVDQTLSKRRRKKGKYQELHPEAKVNQRSQRPDISTVPLKYDDLREAISVIRDFSADGYFLVKDPSKGNIEPYIKIAIACRNAMVKLLDCGREDIHCTVKYCTRAKDEPEGKAKLWTFARSREISGRSMTLGPGRKIFIYKNSSFSSIMGWRDINRNEWERRPYQCFSCNFLTQRSTYADSKKDWHTYYRAGAVFPLRYTKASDGTPTDCIVGFLTFDSLINGVFGVIPSRFDYVGQPDEYLRDFKKTDIYHLGHALADAITMGTVLAGRSTANDLVGDEGED